MKARVKAVSAIMEIVRAPPRDVVLLKNHAYVTRLGKKRGAVKATYTAANKDKVRGRRELLGTEGVAGWIRGDGTRVGTWLRRGRLAVLGGGWLVRLWG